MYSPKIYEKYIPDLFKLKEIFGKPMTALVNEAIEQYISQYRWKIQEYEDPLGNRFHKENEKCPTAVQCKETYQK